MLVSGVRALRRGGFTHSRLLSSLIGPRGRSDLIITKERVLVDKLFVRKYLFLFVCLYFQNSDPMKCAYSLNQDFFSKRTKLKITTAVQRESQQVSIDLAKFCLRALSEISKRQL